MADPAGTSTDSTDTGENGTDPTSTDDSGTESGKDWKAEAEKWKSLSRKHEERAEANAEAARRVKELEDAQLSEQEKLQRERDEARTLAAEKAAEAARLAAAVKYGLTEDDLDLLGDGTPEEIAARAEKLAARLGSSGGDGQQQKPPPVRGLGQGGDGDKPVDVQKVIDSIPPTF